MSFKIVAYGVRNTEIPYFNELNKNHYELKLIPELLSHDNIETTKGMDGVLLRANCVADKTNLDQMKKWGIKYVFTRTVGYNHIDLAAAHKNHQLVARVPAYSPHAVADLAFTLGLSLQRHVSLATFNSKNMDFRITPEEFSLEIPDLTIGIVGTGHIGLTEAKNYKALGSTVLGYDVYQSAEAKKIVKFVKQEDLFAQSDIISLHVPYFPGKNDQFINSELISLMKPTALLVNTARAEIVKTSDIISAIKKKQLGGFATDVITHEKDYFGQKVTKINDPQLQELINLYPRVLITPHIGSYTKKALIDMIQISYENFHDVLTTGTTKNLIQE